LPEFALAWVAGADMFAAIAILVVF